MLGDCGWHPGLEKVDDSIQKVVVPDTEQEDVPNPNIEEVVIASNSGIFPYILNLFQKVTIVFFPLGVQILHHKMADC